MSRRLSTLGAALLLAAACAPFDLATPRPYPCTHDGGGEGECAEGSRCGLDDFCHPLGEAAAYRCETDLDCEASWHCGVDHVCYDRNDAGAIACRVDGGADCAPGWRCGLEQVCHDTDAGAAYLCTADPDCERGWRCGPEGRCLDSAKDALLPSSAESAIQKWKISPVYPGLPLRFASHDPTPPDPSTETLATYLAFDPQGFWAQVEVPTGFGTDYSHQAVRVPYAGAAPSQLAVVGRRAFALSPAGLLEVVAAVDGGTSTVNVTPFPLTTGQLRSTQVDSAASSALVAFDGARFAFADLASLTVHGPFELRDANVQPVPILELGVLKASGSGTDEDWLFSTSRGLYLARRRGSTFLDESGATQSTPTFSPLVLEGLPNTDCDGGTPAPPVWRMRPDVSAAVIGVDVSPAPATPRVASLFRNSGPGLGGFRCTSGGYERTALVDPCPGGGTLVDFRSREPRYFTRCRSQVDGGVVERGYDFFTNADGGFDAPGFSDQATEPPLFQLPADAEGSFNASVDEQGRMARCDEYGCAGLTIKGAPTIVLGTFDGGLTVGPTTDTAHAASAGEYSPGIGFTLPSIPITLRTCAMIQGAPRWTVSCADPGSTLPPPLQVLRWGPTPGPVVAELQDSTQVPGGRGSDPVGVLYPSEVIATPDGGHELIVAAFDRVWAGEIGDRLTMSDVELTAAGVAPLDAKMTPLVGTRIVSLISGGVELDGGTAITAGYLLAGQRVFQYVAENQARWRATEIIVPEGEPQALWTTGGRARVGYASGAVYSLPSRVQIGEALPAGEQPVSSYAAYCTTAYAAGANGAYQLGANPDGGTIGVWTRLALPGLGNQSADKGFAGARLFTTDDEALLFLRNGTAFRLADPACQ